MNWLELSEHARPASRAGWTAVVPAAGKGSRLEHAGPKILFPVAGKPILHWMLEGFQSLVDHVVLVVNPAARAEIQKCADDAGTALTIQLVPQPEPLGMADAVERGLAAVHTDYVWLIWGDQPFFRPSRLATLGAQAQSQNLAGVIPLIHRDQPYVHYELSPEGRLARVLQRREGDALPPNGYSDVGCFGFKTQALRSILAGSPRAPGAVTREWNFLPEIPALEQVGRGLGFARFLATDPETISINTPDEARRAEDYLATRRA